jgi:hypothetical protein
MRVGVGGAVVLVGGWVVDVGEATVWVGGGEVGVSGATVRVGGGKVALGEGIAVAVWVGLGSRLLVQETANAAPDIATRASKSVLSERFISIASTPEQPDPNHNCPSPLSTNHLRQSAEKQTASATRGR